MDMAPRATVVIPVRNSRIHLPKQLEAIARQTIAGELQVIVVDDSSSDGTGDVAGRWCEQHPQLALRVVLRSSRGGPNASRNDGLRLADGPFVLLCDGDDVVGADWAERLVSALEERRGERVLVTGRCVSLDADDQLTDTTLYGPIAIRDTRYMLGGNGGFSRHLANEIGGFDEQIYSGGTEIDFCFRAFDAGAELVFVEDALVGYRQPSGSAGYFARHFRRARGQTYLGRRYGSRSGDSRAVDVWVNPWRQALGTMRLAVRGRAAPHDVPTNLGRALGMSFWGAVFRVRTPPPLLMHAPRERGRCPWLPWVR